MTKKNTSPSFKRKKNREELELKIFEEDEDGLLTPYIKQTETDVTKFECRVCRENGNSYNKRQCRNIISHIESDKHVANINNDTVHKQMLDYINSIKYRSTSGRYANNEVDDDVEGSKVDPERFQFDLAKCIVEKRLPYALVTNLLDVIKYLIKSLNLKTLLNVMRLEL